MRMSMAVALVALLAPHTFSAQTLEGIWRGRIEDRSHQPVEFEMQIGPRETQPAGRLRPLGRGAANTFFVDAARLSADSLVRIEIQTLRIVIEGKLQAGGQMISGTWTQFGSDRQPVHLTRASTPTPPTFLDPVVEIRIPKPPTAVRSNGEFRLHYEIGVSNYTDEHLNLQSVKIQIG